MTNSCKNCKFWIASQTTCDRAGWCNSLFTTMVSKTFGVYASADDDQGLEQAFKTGPDFYCNNHEADGFVRSITFYPPNKYPEYSNQTDYILLLEIMDEDSNGEEVMMTAQFVDDDWWIVYDEDVEQTESDRFGEPLQTVLFEKFEEGFFKLKGWAPLWNGSKPATL